MRCPITYEECGPEKYSAKGLRGLSPRLATLNDFPYTAEEQRQEAVIRAGKMSIQGQQPKLSVKLSIRKGLLEVTTTGGKYILKPQHASFPKLPENEDLTMRLASCAGIEVPFHGLVYCKDNSLSYFTKRFDRFGKNKKLATEDFAQLAGKDRDTKYDYSVEKLIRILDNCTFPAIERVKLYRVFVFSYLVGNEDMHLKNFSLITRDGKTELSPAYDLLNSTIAWLAIRRPSEDIAEIALPLKSKTKNLTKAMLTNYLGIERLELKRESIDKILTKFSSVLSKWRELIKISFLSEPSKEMYTALLNKRAAILGL